MLDELGMLCLGRPVRRSLDRRATRNVKGVSEVFGGATDVRFKLKM